MQSAAATVAEYVTEVPDQRREWVEQIRSDCRELLPGFSEEMAYGMPSYRRPGGELEVAFANQKQYVAVYLRPDVVASHRDRLPDCGKSCIRYRNSAQMDRDLLRELLTVTAENRAPTS